MITIQPLLMLYDSCFMTHFYNLTFNEPPRQSFKYIPVCQISVPHHKMKNMNILNLIHSQKNISKGNVKLLLPRYLKMSFLSCLIYFSLPVNIISLNTNKPNITLRFLSDFFFISFPNRDFTDTLILKEALHTESHNWN